MISKRIPDTDHIARYCSPGRIEHGEIQATAFMLKASEKGLSVNWLEYFNRSNREREIIALRQAYTKKRYTVSANGKFAVMNVGKVKDVVEQHTPDNRKLEIVHEPSIIDRSHSQIYNLRHDDEEIAELMCTLVIEDHPGCI